MSTGLLISLLINILVGAYFFWFYPRSVSKRFAPGRTPRAFAALSRILPPIGAVLIFASVLYGVFAAAGDGH